MSYDKLLFTLISTSILTLSENKTTIFISQLNKQLIIPKTSYIYCPCEILLSIVNHRGVGITFGEFDYDHMKNFVNFTKFDHKLYCDDGSGI